MSDENTTADTKPVLRLCLGSTEMAEKIAAVRAMQPEVGSSRMSIAAILDIFELQTKAIATLETILVGK